MKCKNKCGGAVWWSAARGQWLHCETDEAMCDFGKRVPIRTLRAEPEGDVVPLAVPDTVPEQLARDT